MEIALILFCIVFAAILDGVWLAIHELNEKIDKFYKTYITIEKLKIEENENEAGNQDWSSSRSCRNDFL